MPGALVSASMRPLSGQGIPVAGALLPAGRAAREDTATAPRTE
ncbi:hypothetical protein ACFS5L_27555 [Streptomyces phyllanthi]|nr:hypothetical protein [Streptomyces phyllanthi]